MTPPSSTLRNGAHNCAIYISGGIGDGVLYMVFAKALAEQTGGTVSLLMTQNESAQELFRAQPYVREVISLRSENQLRGWERITRVRQILVKQRYDALFLFTVRAHMAMAAYLAGIPQRAACVRMHQPQLAALLTDWVWVRRKGTPHPDFYTWLPPLFAKAGYQFSPTYPSLFCHPAATDKALLFCDEKSRTIGFGLSGSNPSKRYGASAFAEVARILHERDAGLRFVLVGGSDVRHDAQEIRARVPPSVVILDATQQTPGLCESQALVACCSVFVSNDSMGLHIAVAHEIPTIGLFGATPPLRYAPWLHAIKAERDGDMTTIAPEIVAEAVWKCLDVPGGR